MMDPVSGMLLGGAALGGLNSALGIGASAADAALQYHYAKKMYQHRYRWAMSDMRKAGLNPILAANGGSVAGMGSAPSTDFSGAIQTGVNSGLSAARQVSDMHAQQVTNAKTEADTKSVNQDVVSKTIKNKYLEPQEEAFTKDAMARAANNTALATLNAARAANADELAFREMQGMSLRNENEQERLLQNNYKTFNAIQDYGMRPKGKEAVFWDRLDRVSKAVGRGVNSALGVGKLRALSKGIY